MPVEIGVNSEIDGDKPDTEIEGFVGGVPATPADGLNGVHRASPHPLPPLAPNPAPTPPPPPPPPAPTSTPAPTPPPPPPLPVHEPGLASPMPHLVETTLAAHIPREESPMPRRWRRAELTPEPAPMDTGASQDHATAVMATIISNAPPVVSLVPTRIPTAEPNPLLPTSLDLLDSSDWPKHMVDANCYFTEDPLVIGDGSVASLRDWGIEWLACVREFVLFQQAAGFPDGGASYPPATDVRPPEIGAWMKNRRPWRDVEIKDVEKFARQWRAWWNTLQPKSRSGEAEPTVDMDWSQLQKPGKNGILLIMMSLVWWGKASNRDEGWSKAISDVSAVLLCMRGALGASGDIVKARGVLSGSSAANTARLGSSKRGCGENAISEKEGSSKRARRR